MKTPASVNNSHVKETGRFSIKKQNNVSNAQTTPGQPKTTLSVEPKNVDMRTKSQIKRDTVKSVLTVKKEMTLEEIVSKIKLLKNVPVIGKL